jgi:hypothetical protein
MTTNEHPGRAMTMREIREDLGHVQPGQPEVIVSVTRYTVSVLPTDDINHRYFALQVELKPRGWVVHNGHEFYAEDGSWQPSQALAHYFADHDEAIAFARETAPDVVVNGHTAVDAYRRTHPAS